MNTLGLPLDPTRSDAAAAYLAAIVDSSDDAIISKDLNGVIQSFNAAAERIFGYTAAELIGQPVLILIPPDRLNEEADILARIRRGERIDHFQTVRRAKDGRLVNVSITVSAVRDRQGVVIGASKIARDVTAEVQAVERERAERRRAEEERATAAAERERLLEAERVARAEAERASRVKDDFVAMVSHELRTPLNAILGWTELMMRSRHDAAVLDRGLEVVARNTRLQAQLISDLLDISRIVAGKLRLETQNVNLRSIVDDALAAVEREADAKDVEVEATLAIDVATLPGDPARLQQVVWNLLTNAIKFTPSGGHVRVSLRAVGGQFELTVADTGVGIRADVLPFVFDRFHQPDRSIARRYGGLGLGLSIVKHLVELHGGEARAASPGEGQGATFTILLPGATGAEVAVDAPAPAVPVPSYGDVVLDGVRVLIVEDEPDTRDFLQRLLAGQGAIVRTAASAAEALALVHDDAPDLLISDIGLPEVDGYELMQRIREIQLIDGHAIPAIALTAYARSEDRTRALRAGYQAHMAKPIEPLEFMAMVASFVELTDSQRRKV
jgi:PAS domain S-box-containing protein